MKTCNNIKTLMRPIRAFLTGVLLVISQAAYSQIVIGGDIYGGGREGAVGTGKATNQGVDVEHNNQPDLTKVVLKSDALTGTTSNIQINAGQVRTVFGGGQNGKTFGNTSVTISGGTIGNAQWEGSIHGGIFGAGDGASAVVFGNSNVTLQGGTIIQNIYGGGNEAELVGTTSVTLKGGDIQSTVYGGARVANINGYSLVNIDGEHATNDLIIKAVYGGNDIAGNITIPSGNHWSWIRNLAVPSVCTEASGNGVNGNWNAFVTSTPSTDDPGDPNDAEHTVYIGQLFGGGNGDYPYSGTEGNYTLTSLKVWDSSTNNWKNQNYTFSFARKPEVSNVYLELKGGIFGYVYGGGNQATVTNKTVICLDNPTAITDGNKNLYNFQAAGLREMGINLDVDKHAYDLSVTDYAVPKYQFDRVFGGNKQAVMSIQPTWKLKKADINSLYSGGDAGDMTNSTGLLLAITSSNMTVNNVYGGCRIANVNPGAPIQAQSFPVDIFDINGTATTSNYDFQAEYAARVLITAGTINNVYGGNDISGNVYGGTALEILSSINGEVYGGGNGSYVYTDNSELETDATYGDFYYNPGNLSSVEALNAHRPSTSKTYIHIAGTQSKPITVQTVYGGGNSTTVSDAIKLRLGTYATIDNIFLGSNGINMKSTETLETYAGSHNGKDISSLNFKDGNGTFNTYMLGAAVSCQPVLEFDNGYSSSISQPAMAHVGSFYCGGNVGSMTSANLFDIKFTQPIVITNKIVGGCNTAFVAAGTYNVLHEGGFIGGNGTADKIHLDIDGVIFTTTPQTTATAGNQGNIFGGCFESGIVKGNVKIDLKENIIPATYFADVDKRNTYLTSDSNLFKTPLSVFGGGFGENATVQGNTTVNVFDGQNVSGSALKVFGGGYGGAVDGNTTVNIYGENSFIGRLYGGGFEGPVTGSTTVNLDGGTVYHSFGGSCNADITGYAQTYVGAGLGVPSGTIGGMTTVLGNVYGGNDFGGTINISGNNSHNFSSRISTTGYTPETSVVTASAYVEYQQATISGYLFGGSCGRYDYATINHTHTDPYLQNAFVNFRPIAQELNAVGKVFGAGEGYPIPSAPSATDITMDQMQDRSYVLVDFSNSITSFNDLEVFGSGAYSGLGMGISAASSVQNPGSATAVVDLINGTIKNVYGASLNQGITRRTNVRVPSISTIIVNENIYGGGYGEGLTTPCDVIESVVDFNSNNAIVNTIFGGNNHARRTLYSTININSKARSSTTNTSYTAGIYGGGYGEDTWSQYTTVNLNNNANVYYAYGGGNAGNVLNKESFDAWVWYAANRQENPVTIYSKLGGGYDTQAAKDLLESELTHLNPLGKITNTNVYFNRGSYSPGYSYGGGKSAHVSGSTYIGIHGGIIDKDVYAAGESGDVRVLYPEYWTSQNQTIPFTAETNAFIEGGTVRRIYGGGWKGNVGYTELPFKLTKAQLEDDNYLTTTLAKDVPGATYVVIGLDESEAQLRNLGNNYNFYKGKPAIEWNAYGAGERGGIIGTANLIMNNGYIGYRYFENVDEGADHYQEKLDDETAKDGVGRNYLIEHGNLFGGGYDDGSYTDYTNVKVYGGVIRNSVYGGGEIAAIGRGQTKETGQLNSVRELLGIAKAGKTNVEIYGGEIHASAFGGGKGYSATKAEEYAYSADRRYTDGYVFGQTEINVRGGVIGTDKTLLAGEGNVFGGGNIGYVYTKTGTKTTGTGADGYYYDSNNQLTEDCKTVISPWAKVNNGQTVTINDTEYNGAKIDGNGIFQRADYVPTSALNTFKTKASLESEPMDVSTGLIIQNAVFAGGNVSQGSDLLYAEATTVFGNATASVMDLFCKDLITLGQEGIGGLYGDGNLTFVDGYRELNITDYGTDYWNLKSTITYDEYKALNDRERAYFRLTYVCQTTFGSYEQGDKIYSDEYDLLTPEEQANFKVDEGICNIYAGRMMNTIQRADYCGIFGSRMVMKGARDRVPAEVDYTNYTINRVGEIGLHKTTVDNTLYGTYFGIYNIVNYLGALTSDLEFTDNMEGNTGTPVTYYTYKSGKKGKQNRNKGESHNEVALASGVYLELLQEPERNYVGDEKIYGPITGVVQLNLIAAATGEGGGYVYAKNVHGTQHKYENATHLTLAAANAGAVTNKYYYYDASQSSSWMQTSGNFVSGETIIDECFPTANSYYPETNNDEYSPAHYWFIKGDFYVYNQEISAYTGSAQSYIKNVNIPLTILAQGNGLLEIETIKTNLYADATQFPYKSGSTTERDTSVICNGITYCSNDPISYWDWSNLSAAEKLYFTDKTYVCVADVYTTEALAEAGGTPAHAAGEVFTETQYNSLAATWYNNKAEEMAKDRAFRLTNALSHENGYMLAVSLDQPSAWDEYYTHVTSGTKITREAYDASPDADYKLGPTYHLNPQSGETGETKYIFGQSEYNVGDLMDEGLVDKYNELDATAKSNLTAVQATFEPAYMALTTCDVTMQDDETNSHVKHVVERSAIPESEYNKITDATEKSYFAKAYIALETVRLTDKQLLSGDQLYSYNELSEYATAYPDKFQTQTVGGVTSFIGYPRAYYCSEAGSYGGTTFTSGQNYQATMYANLEPAERSKFSFNYDALDLMLRSNYPGEHHIDQYDKPNTTPLYSASQSIDYKVMYNGNSGTLYGYGNNYSLAVTNGTIYTRDQFEQLANEKRHYAQISTNSQYWKDDQDNLINTQDLYIITELFVKGRRTYNVGEVISKADYEKLEPSEQNANTKIMHLTKTAENSYTYSYDGTQGNLTGTNNTLTFYLCTDSYVKPQSTTTVALNEVITESEYNGLNNYQKDFEVIAGIPQEKSALYVSRDCDIFDFTGDRIFTIIYRYKYAEPNDETGVYKNVAERHILNIRVHFESGQPIIGELLEPSILLPGTTIGLTKPSVQKGAFEVLGGGWELYENYNNALTHKNGIPYANYTTPMYWYQDGWYVAYYAETYLGRTFSNAVPFTIANYHDLAAVMADADNHLKIDHPGVKSNSKIYIDNRQIQTQGITDKSELDLLYDLYDLSLQPHGTKDLIDENGDVVEDANGNAVQIDDYDIKYDRNGELHFKHSALNDHVKGLANLEFILNSDVAPKKYTSWTPLGTYSDDNDNTNDNCFSGNLHGNGYTISGLDKSLFSYLCGNVYNLGVRGSIAGSGIADHGGYAQNCWLINDAAADLSSYKAILNDGVIVNGYYNDDAATVKYTSQATAISKPMSSFINGEVAYNLNGFYLKKRHYDKENSVTTKTYSYYTVNPEDNTLTENEKYADVDDPLYVENYYMDGQFVYANGTIPTGKNERFADKDGGKHYPIYPDDYIFFGQKLTYDMTGAAAHDVQPKAIRKTTASNGGQRIDLEATGNRVFRAPAYYGSSTMGKAYFNSFARFAATYQGTDAYAGMTAIDFTGNGDATWTDGAVQANYYKPVLDYSGLKGFNVLGLTKNLLVYVDYTNDDNSYNVLNGVLLEPTFTNHTTTANDYSTVTGLTNAELNSIKGHLVRKQGSNYVADKRQFLVDGHDFNAPIGYEFQEDDFMWYQRTPSVYVESMEGGWESVSLPFTVDLVTTQNKGEITHFYENSNTGHEYWLREYSTVDATNGKVQFKSLDRASSGSKTVANTFLWDYYYNGSNHKDANSDNYIDQAKTGYSSSRTYEKYPLAAAGTPYLIGFPGGRYYEFDLSGSFEAANTGTPAPTKLQKQIITFASVNGQEIDVTDTEYANGATTADGYTYHPTYQAKTVNNVYMLAADGMSFNQAAEATTVPFRTYLTASSASPAPKRAGTRADVLYIGYTGDVDLLEEAAVDRGLYIYGEHMNIIIESTLEVPAPVTITTVAGRTLKQLTIQPGTKVTVPVNSRGVYIVNRHKIAVAK